ncbi:MAG: response regulator [Terriglobales bacterium]
MNRHILLIEDDEPLLAAMAEYFQCHGYEVKTAGEAEEAVAMLRNHRFDVAITDLELNSIEGLDGFGVLKALRQASPGTKVIIYSGHADSMIVEAAIGQGGISFIAKPSSFTELLASVEDLCALPS